MAIKEKTARVFVIIIMMAAFLDVVTTHVGVFILGTKEIGVVASWAMKEIGESWWALYLPYETAILLGVFFGVRHLRTHMSGRISFGLLKIPAEHFVILVTYLTVLNNTLHIIPLHI